MITATSAAKSGTDANVMHHDAEPRGTRQGAIGGYKGRPPQPRRRNVQRIVDRDVTP